MTEASSAPPEPPRRPRGRDRAALLAPEDDSWSRLLEAAADSTPPSAATGSNRPSAVPPPLMSRRAARRREAEAFGSPPPVPMSNGTSSGTLDATPDTPAGGAFSTGGVPLRPWWAGAGGTGPADLVGTGERPAVVDAAVPTPAAGIPAAFRRADPLPASPDSEHEPAREPAQVNPWPGQVPPALPTDLPSSRRRRAQTQRTSDVSAPAREVAPPREVVLPREIVLPADPADIPSTPRVSRSSEPAHSTNAPVLGGGPVLPAPELPGPVLPGVDGVAEAEPHLVSRPRRPARSRRRLAATPTRFPALGPGGEPLEQAGSSPGPRFSGPADGADGAVPGALDLVADLSDVGDHVADRVPQRPDSTRPRRARSALRAVGEDETTRLIQTVPDGGDASDLLGPATDGTPARRSRRTAPTAEPAELSRAPLAAVPAPMSNRAGRNLPAAIGVGVALGGTVIASLLIRKEAFVLVVAAAVVTALWEVSTALRQKRISIPLVPLSVGALGMLVSAFVAGEDGLLVSFTLTAFGVLLWRLIDGHQGAARDVAAAVFVAAYVPFLAGFAMLMLATSDGAYRVLVFLAVTVANDVGGYASGVLLGRHPMAPSISPKKSWEGLAGSFALCMVVGAGTVYYLLSGSVLAGLALGAGAAVTATIGDLSESLIKRDIGIKDMGKLLPGHGGIMDRLDSLLPTAPAAFLLLSVLVPVATTR